MTTLEYYILFISGCALVVYSTSWITLIGILLIFLSHNVLNHKNK